MTDFRIDPELPEYVQKALMELNLRRKQMRRFPFCSDHRDKVFGKKDCRECMIEGLSRLVEQLQNKLQAYEFREAHPEYSREATRNHDMGQ